MDRRPKRTRNQLINALFVLLHHKDYDDITVQDIIDGGDVALSSFYRHYANKQALLHDLITVLPTMISVDAFLSPMPIAELVNEKRAPNMLLIVRFIASNRVFLRRLLSSPLPDFVYQTLHQTGCDSIRHTTPELSDHEVYAIVNAALGFIYQTILIDKPIDAEEMAMVMHHITIYGNLLMRPENADVLKLLEERYQQAQDDAGEDGC
jgi:AcrR family transcriptional regulator